MDTRRTTEHTLRKGMAYSESSAGGGSFIIRPEKDAAAGETTKMTTMMVYVLCARKDDDVFWVSPVFLSCPIEEEPPSIQSRVTTTLKKKVTQEFGGQKQE